MPLINTWVGCWLGATDWNGCWLGWMLIGKVSGFKIGTIARCFTPLWASCDFLLTLLLTTTGKHINGFEMFKY